MGLKRFVALFCLILLAPCISAITDGFDGNGGDDCGDFVEGFDQNNVFLSDDTTDTNTLEGELAKDNTSVPLKGAVLGFFREENGTVSLTSATAQFDEQNEMKISTFLDRALSKAIKEGKGRVLWNVGGRYDVIALVNIGRRNRGVNDVEQVDEDKEAVRLAVAAGLKNVWDGTSKTLSMIDVDTMEDPEAAAESAYLTIWTFDVLKKGKKNPPELVPIGSNVNIDAWTVGKVKAESQNLARYLSEMPANLMTPKIMAAEAKKALEPLGVTVNAHETEWIQAEEMGSFLSVSHGSIQPPIFLEIFYNGSDATNAPFVFVGKGITFDSGGVSLKTPSSNMMWMRGDMGGGAVVIATIQALAALKTPINAIGLVPLTENMMGGRATKVMDVVRAKNGKTIEISNTDAEGRLVLADALAYSEKFNPKVIVDIATLTGGVITALGRTASGVFTRNNMEYERLLRASMISGDRIWRLPLWDYYTQAIAPGHLADVLNSVGDSSWGASSPVGAAFLREFVPKGVPWIHMDIAGATRAAVSADSPYYAKGFTGRPVRTLVQFAMDFDEA